MGNLAIAAVAHTTNFEKEKLQQLLAKCKELAERDDVPKRKHKKIDRRHFVQSVRSVAFEETEADILDRLFVMASPNCVDAINYLEFLASLAPLIKGDTHDRLELGFELYDADKTDIITKKDMKTIMKAMNDTAMYFGDPVMREEQIIELVEDIFQNHQSSVVQREGNEGSVDSSPSSDSSSEAKNAMEDNSKTADAEVTENAVKADAVIEDSDKANGDDDNLRLRYKECFESMANHQLVQDYLDKKGTLTYDEINPYKDQKFDELPNF